MVREETRFFAKSEQMPPPDAPTYYVQAGVLRKPASQDATMPELTSKPIARAGGVWRADNNLGVGASVLGLADRAATELSTFWLAGGAQVRATALASTRGDVGAQLGLLYIGSAWSANFDARKLWTQTALAEEYEGLLNDVTQMTGNINYLPHPDITLSFRGSYSANSNLPATTSFGPAVSWRLWQEGESTLNASADAARNSGRNEGTALIRFTYRLGSFGVSNETGAGYGGNSRGVFSSARAWHDHVDQDESLRVGAGVQGDSRNRSVSLDGEWQNSTGFVQGGVQKYSGDSSALAYGGNFTLGALQASDSVHIGGVNQNMSAIVVSVDGNADSDAEFIIEVDGTPRGTVRAGKTQAIYLTPYQNYRVSLTAKNGGMLSVKGGVQKVILYPGNVAELRWQADRFTVVAARVITADGAPLKDAILNDSNALITTNDQGRFQAELTQLDVLNFTMSDGNACQVTLPSDAKAASGVLIYNKPLRCQL